MISLVFIFVASGFTPMKHRNPDVRVTRIKANHEGSCIRAYISLKNTDKRKINQGQVTAILMWFPKSSGSYGQPVMTHQLGYTLTPKQESKYPVLFCPSSLPPGRVQVRTDISKKEYSTKLEVLHPVVVYQTYSSYSKEWMDNYWYQWCYILETDKGKRIKICHKW